MPTSKRPRSERTPAPDRPVARVAVDTPLPHLDKPFDYLVDAASADAAVPGCRVRVRFAGKLVDGYLLERTAATEHTGRLSYVERVVSAEPVLTPEIAGLARAVADRWAGTLSDVLRLAIPPRHAGAESGSIGEPTFALAPEPTDLDLPAGLVEFVNGLRRGDPSRVVAAVPPGDWPAWLATIAAATLAGGRSAILVVPDHRDVARLSAALTLRLGADGFVALAADLGPAERYRRFLAVRRGHVRCVVGTRSAVWAPAVDLGLVAVWDDGDDLHAEPRAPYCHARDVAVLRAHRGGAACLIAGHAVSAEGAMLAGRGWATSVDATEGRRDSVPTIRAVEDAVDGADPVAQAARLPTIGWRTARDALAAGAPVLVQVPRSGYQPSLACNRCRSPARCERCAGPLGRRTGAAAPQCRWCGATATAWRCPECGAGDLRAVVVGVGRTAEELGRAFPGATVRTSSGEHVVATVPDRPVLVVATPGAEPVAASGYGAALLLDGWSMLTRPDLRAAEETLRRWLNAAALVRPASAGGRVIIAAATELRPVQALLRWRPWWYAERELADRAELHLPPAARLAAVTGPSRALTGFLGESELPAGAEVLGPVPVASTGDVEQARLLIRVPSRSGLDLAAALKAATATRSARKEADVVRVSLDPVEVG